MIKDCNKNLLSETEKQEMNKDKEAGKRQPIDSKKGKEPVNPKAKEPTKGVDPVASSSRSTGGVSKANPKTQTITPAMFNSEVAGILKELHDNQTKISNKLDNLSTRVDNIYDYSNEEYEGSLDTYDAEQYENVCVDGDFENVDPNETYEGASVVSEPPTKIQKLDKSSIFKNISDKFNPKEVVDSDINEELAEFINSAFREGISDDKQTELLKEIHRPSNCNFLVKTTVNQPIWRLLKPHTQTDDVKMQSIQNNIIKAAINFTKILNECGESIGQNLVEMGTSALALLGQSNKQINNKRKEFHKVDLDAKYHYLSSQNLPYTDKLYGDDVNKNIKEIQDINRLSKNIGRGSGSTSRGNFRGRRPYKFINPGRGRGRGRGYGRGMESQHSYSSTASSTGSASKNGKSGAKR
ncbi:MAG: hypothetical protein AB2693_32925 [Candidatus Thiodiazotropha sp.]